MADDTGDFDWSEFGEQLFEAAVSIAVTVAVNEATNALMGGKNKAGSQSAHFSMKQPVPPVWVLVGDHYRIAPAFAFLEKKDNCTASVQAINDGRIDEDIAGIYLNDDVVTLGEDGRVITVNGSGGGPYMDHPNPRVVVQFRYGLSTETVYEPINSRWGDIWDEDHRGDGTASLAFLCFAPQAKFMREAFPVGKPEISVAARAVCYDWRDESQDKDDPDTWAWSANPVVWLVHLEWFRWGMDWERCIEPVLGALSGEADYCDGPVSLDGGGTEPRYRCAGGYRDNEDRDSIRKKILATMDGYRTMDGRGRLVVQAGRYVEPTVTLTERDIVSFSWQSGVKTEDSADSLNVSFTSPAANYVQVECDPWVINEEGSIVDDFYAEWTPSFTQARRLAKRAAARINVQSSGSFVTNVGGLRAWGQRYVRIQIADDPDLDDIVVELPEGIEMSGVDGFSFSAQLISSSIDAWNPATEEGNDPGAPAVEAYAPLAAPEITSVTPIYDVLGARIEIEAEGPDREDLTWSYRWRVDGDTAWTEFTDSSVTGGTVTILTGAVPADEAIEVEVSYRTTAASPWSDTESVATSSSGIAPASPTGFTASGGTGSITATWTNPNSANLAGTRLWRGTVGSPFSVGTYTSIGSLYSGLGVTHNPTITGQTPGSYDIYVTAENASGTKSPEVGPQTITVT